MTKILAIDLGKFKSVTCYTARIRWLVSSSHTYCGTRQKTTDSRTAVSHIQPPWIGWQRTISGRLFRKRSVGGF